LPPLPLPAAAHCCDTLLRSPAGALHSYSNPGCEEAEAVIVLSSSLPDTVYPIDQLLRLPQQAQICEHGAADAALLLPIRCRPAALACTPDGRAPPAARCCCWPFQTGGRVLLICGMAAAAQQRGLQRPARVTARAAAAAAAAAADLRPPLPPPSHLAASFGVNNFSAFEAGIKLPKSHMYLSSEQCKAACNASAAASDARGGAAAPPAARRSLLAGTAGASRRSLAAEAHTAAAAGRVYNDFMASVSEGPRSGSNSHADRRRLTHSALWLLPVLPPPLPCRSAPLSLGCSLLPCKPTNRLHTHTRTHTHTCRAWSSPAFCLPAEQLPGLAQAKVEALWTRYFPCSTSVPRFQANAHALTTVLSGERGGDASQPAERAWFVSGNRSRQAENSCAARRRRVAVVAEEGAWFGSGQPLPAPPLLRPLTCASAANGAACGAF
jgi:hypothetical protein